MSSPEPAREYASEGSYTQIAFVVHDLVAAVASWARTVNAGPFYVFDNVVENVVYRGLPGADTNRVAMGFLGVTNIEFVQPTNGEPSIYREILDVRGDSFHHTLPSMRAFSTDEFDVLCANYEGMGLRLASSGTIPGFGRIKFYDALEDTGQFIEAIELNADAYAVMDRVHDAHARWNGNDPIRPFAALFGNVTAH